MRTYAVVLCLILALEICKCATVSEAEEKLKELRALTRKALDEANIEHGRMSNDVDATTLETKEYATAEIQKKIDRFLAKLKADKARNHRCRGSRDNIAEHLKNHHSKKLVDCVNQKGKNGVDLTSKQKLDLSQYTWLATFDEEKVIVECGEDEECLDRVVANIDDQLEEVRNVIEEELKIKEHQKENQLEHIRRCATESIAKVEIDLNQTPTCVY